MTDPISMPWGAPMFPVPPHSWKGVRTAVVPFSPDPDAVRQILPPGLEAADGLGLVTMLCYGWGHHPRIHPFNEAVVLVPVRCDGQEGNYVPFIYVTTDEALIAGREAAGWPKKLAEVTWEGDDERFAGQVTRWGETILTVQGEVGAEPPQDFDAAALMGTSARPTFNYKLIPGPGDEVEVEEITATTLTIEPSTVELGRATLQASSSPTDPLAAIVPPTTSALIMMESDNTIPLGTVVKRIEGRVRR
jgi:acetoacetate decarboxylase